MEHTHSGRRGSALGLVLMVVAIAAILAFSLASSTVLNLHVATWAVARTHAQNGAESAIAMAAAAMMAAEDDGAAFPSSTINLTTLDGTLGYLTFDPLNGQGLLWSYNNLTGTTPAAGAVAGQIVPPGTVQFIGTGSYGITRVEVEAIINYPAFPYVVASSGRFLSPSGGVTVAQVRKGASLCAGLAGLSKCCILPGNMISNNGCRTAAICLGPGSRVTGTAQAVGGIRLAAGTCVVGVQPCSCPVTLPSINVRLDPTAAYSGVQPVGPNSGSLSLSGLARAACGATVNGCLNLCGALLYVHGTLCVSGQLTGTGAVIASGGIAINGGAHLRTTDIVALEAGGNVSLIGSSCASNTFFGLIYTQGNLVAKNLQLYGNFVANGTIPCACTGSVAPCAGNVTMCNVHMSMVDDGVSVTLSGCIVTPVSSGGCVTCCCCWSICACVASAMPSTSLQLYGTPPCCLTILPVPSGTKTHTKVTMHKGGKMHLETIGCCAFHPVLLCACVPTCPPCCSTCASKAAKVLGYAVAALSAMSAYNQVFSNPVSLPLLHCPSVVADMSACHVMCEVLATKQSIAHPYVAPSIRGSLHRALPCSVCLGTTVYNFNFDQYIAPANLTRILLWREL